MFIKISIITFIISLLLFINTFFIILEPVMQFCLKRALKYKGDHHLHFIIMIVIHCPVADSSSWIRWF